MVASPLITPRMGQRIAAPLFDLQRALDPESFWQANLSLLQEALPHHSCSLMLDIEDFTPLQGRHHVVADAHPDYQPATSLSISRNFLASHPSIKLYTYSQVVREDPTAARRRPEQEAIVGDWVQFVHLAFWHKGQPEAVLSVRRGPREGDFTRAELRLLENLYPVIHAGLHRLRVLEEERTRSFGFERFLETLPVPILHLDATGRLQLATNEGYELCAAWNYGWETAKHLDMRRAFRVPDEIRAACAALTRPGAAVSGMVRVPHPTMSGLVARVMTSERPAGRRDPTGFFVLLAAEHNVNRAGIELGPSALSALQRLSPSERRVALLVKEGCSNEEIAGRMGKSLRTVESQLYAVFRKWGIRSRVHLVNRLR